MNQCFANKLFCDVSKIGLISYLLVLRELLYRQGLHLLIFTLLQINEG